MPKKDDIVTGLVLLGTTTLGYMVANGLTNSIAKIDDENAVLTDEQKKTKLLVSLGNVAVGGGLAVMQKGNGLKETAIKGVGIGMGTYGARSLVSHLSKENDLATISTGNTSGDRFLKGALACACDGSNASARTVVIPTMERTPVLRMPVERSNKLYSRNGVTPKYQRAS